MLYDLQVNRLTNPVGLDDKSLFFSWKMFQSGYDIWQDCYNVRVYEGEKILWESGKTKSNDSAGILYQGPELTSGTAYDWTVTVWDNRGKEHLPTQKSSFFTGVLDESIWRGSKWIKESSEEFVSLPVFSYAFPTKKKVKSAVLFSTALGNYDISINRKRVGHSTRKGEIVYDELKPGFTEPKMQVHYQTYDVTYCLDEIGDNQITVLTGTGWWLGRIVANHETHVMNPDRQGKQIAFRAVLRITYADGETVWIKTNEEWKFSNSSPILASDIYDGEVWDYTAKICDLSDWKPVAISNEFHGIINSSCGHNVHIRRDLQRKGVPFRGKDSLFLPVKISPGNGISIDLGQNIVGWEEIELSSDSEAKITVTHAESLYENGTLNYGCNRNGLARSVYKIKKGKKLILKPLLTYYGFRYLHIESNAESTVHRVNGIVLSAITREMESGTIITDCAPINQLAKNVLWSQRGNFSSVPTDCPQRDERHAFTGDVQIYAVTASYYADVYTYLKKWLLEDVANLQHSDGSYPSTAPQSRQIERYGMAGWSDGGIMIPYRLYKMNGDKSILKEHFNSMSRFMDYLEKNGGPGIHYGDWAMPNEKDNTPFLKQLLADVYYCIDLKMFVCICDILGKEKEKQKYDALLQERKDYFAKRYTCADGFQSNCIDSEGLIYQTACVYAIYYDLIDDKSVLEKIQHQLSDNLKHYKYHLKTGFLGTPVLLPALSKANLNQEAYQLLLQDEEPSWLYSVKKGATTVWEYWDGRCSQNHFAYGSVAEWLFAYLAGIKPDLKNSGFKHIIIEPKIIANQTISQVKAEYNSPYGFIKVEWKLSENGFHINLEIPPNTSATLILPRLFLTGDFIISENANDNKKESLLSDDNLHYQLNSGRYSFVIKKKEE